MVYMFLLGIHLGRRRQKLETSTHTRLSVVTFHTDDTQLPDGSISLTAVLLRYRVGLLPYVARTHSVPTEPRGRYRVIKSIDPTLHLELAPLLVHPTFDAPGVDSSSSSNRR